MVSSLATVWILELFDFLLFRHFLILIDIICKTLMKLIKELKIISNLLIMA